MSGTVSGYSGGIHQFSSLRIERLFQMETPKQYQELTIDSTFFERCSTEQNFTAIMNDPNLFWLAYCHALLPHQNPDEAWVFSITKEEKNIKISARDHALKKTQEKVEEIRKYLVEGFKSKNVEILVMKKLMDFYLGKPELIIDLSQRKDGYSQKWHRNFIEPALPKMAEFCGAQYEKGEKLQDVKFDSSLSTFANEKFETIKISWK
jgi:hypothetical protein